MWAKTTWKGQFSAIAVEVDTGQKLFDILEKFNLAAKNITGESVTKLERTAEDSFPRGLNISYSKAFDNAYSEDPQRLPILFLRNLASEFDFESAPPGRFEGLMARGLRTFPSLLRDRDFGENLEKFLKTEDFSGAEFSVSVNPEEDIPQHTDVLLRLREQEYRIWLYQFTSRGLPHDIERVLGRRGKLPEGIHVLCPLKTDLALHKEKLERKLCRLTKRLAGAKLRHAKYESKECKGALNCLQTSLKTHDEIKQVRATMGKVSPVVDNEICTINGWYFYSERKIKSILSRIVDVDSDETPVDSYSDVCRILTGPENYLGEIRFFSI